jgi:hypothetical protein
MTLKEREERVKEIKLKKDNFEAISNSLNQKAKSFRILSDMCDYLITRLESGEEFDYENLEKFIINEHKKIIGR